MLTDEVAAASGIKLKMTRALSTLAVLLLASACAGESVLPSQAAPTPLAHYGSTTLLEPLLFVVDGVKYQRDQLPLITSDRIFAVRVVKGRAALELYGKDASYGVVVITTMQGAGRRA